jgi:hypothetical protein
MLAIPQLFHGSVHESGAHDSDYASDWISSWWTLARRNFRPTTAMKRATDLLHDGLKEVPVRLMIRSVGQ